MTCPHCGQSARFVNYRRKQITTLLGDITLHRPYYHCQACQTGCFPWDQTLRLRLADRHRRRRIGVQNRRQPETLHGGGMRWAESGSDAVCHLRALWRSALEHWDQFWANSIPT